MSLTLRSRSRVWVVLTPAASFFVLFACGKFGASDQDVADGGTNPDQLAQGDGASTFVPPDAATCVFMRFAGAEAGDPGTSGAATSGGSTSGASTSGGSTSGAASSGASGAASSGASGPASSGASGAASSGASGGGALCAETYTCLGRPVTVSCDCQTQRCSCNGTVVAGQFLCAGGPSGPCAIASVNRTACGLPDNAPP
jgi:hypothetical protein